MSLPAFIFPAIKFISFWMLLYSTAISCSTGSKNPGKSGKKPVHKYFRMVMPPSDAVFSAGSTVNFSLEHDDTLKADSVILFNSGDIIHKEKISPSSFMLHDLFRKTGRQNLRVVVYFNNGFTETISRGITILSDIKPASLTYKIVRQIPHSKEDYTQGLVYWKGKIYESTGREGYSRLIRKNPETGALEMERKMDKSIFGEGITILNEKIYQLTYRQKIGFIYDVENFELIREFDLQTLEGWGLTNDLKNIIASDGSMVLNFYDPEYLNQTGQLQVADDVGLTDNLNELEFAEGNIWANVYGESYIIKIEYETGKILGILELENLYPQDIPRNYDHVLNGIAYNPDRNTFFVTGKLWPVMYEITIE